MSVRKNASRLDFLTPVSQVPGFGPKRILAFAETHIKTIGDLLYRFPQSYIDRSDQIALSNVSEHLNKRITVEGVVTKVQRELGRKARIRVFIEDGSGTLELLWFQGVSLVQKQFKKGKKVLVHGKVVLFHSYQVIHPYYEIVSIESVQNTDPYIPQYHLTDHMHNALITQSVYIKAVRWILKNIRHYPQRLPHAFEVTMAFPPLSTCLKHLHFPRELQRLPYFLQRLKYEELFQVVLKIRMIKIQFSKPGRQMNPGEFPKIVEDRLPFLLTVSQKKAIAILYSDAASSKRMHRMLRADVGTGKTIVAFFACLPALRQGLQVVWCCSTEMLAWQAFHHVSVWLSWLGIIPRMITDSTSIEEKRNLALEIREGTSRFLVGTHAVIQDSIHFASLGMIVVDEYNGFGIEQRMSVLQKDFAADFLLFCASPIPQKLVETMYSDLESVSIENKYAKRSTFCHRVPLKKISDMEKFILSQILGDFCQVLYVVPPSEQNKYKRGIVHSVYPEIITFVEQLKRRIFDSVSISVVHEEMTSAQKLTALNTFVSGKAKILVAPSEKELAVNAISAHIIVIVAAECLGLNQLHLLRDRIGRDGKKGYVFLLCSAGFEEDESVTQRLALFCNSSDGFELAECELRLQNHALRGGFKNKSPLEVPQFNLYSDIHLLKEMLEQVY